MNEVINALVFMYQADLQKAKANLVNYLNNPAGVGEHPDIVAECKNLVDDMEHARGCLDLLKGMFPPQESNGQGIV